MQVTELHRAVPALLDELDAAGHSADRIAYPFGNTGRRVRRSDRDGICAMNEAALRQLITRFASASSSASPKRCSGFSSSRFCLRPDSDSHFETARRKCLPSAQSRRNSQTSLTAGKAAERRGVLEHTGRLQALRTGKIALLAIAADGNKVEYRFDDTNPEGRTARMLADRAIQRAAGRVDPGTFERSVFYASPAHATSIF